MAEESERETLQALLGDIERLMRECRTTRRELKDMEVEAARMYAAGGVSRLRYEVHKQRAGRVLKKTNDCLERLVHQRKRVLWQLGKLEK